MSSRLSLAESAGNRHVRRSAAGQWVAALKRLSATGQPRGIAMVQTMAAISLECLMTLRVAATGIRTAPVGTATSRERAQSRARLTITDEKFRLYGGMFVGVGTGVGVGPAG